MKKVRSIFMLLLLCFNASLSMASESVRKSVNQTSNNITETQLSDQLFSLRIMLVKLRKLMFSLKDLSELEAIGLSHSDVDIMRSTLLAKINQTRGDTLVLIRSM